MNFLPPSALLVPVYGIACALGAFAISWLPDTFPWYLSLMIGMVIGGCIGWFGVALGAKIVKETKERYIHEIIRHAQLQMAERESQFSSRTSPDHTIN